MKHIAKFLLLLLTATVATAQPINQPQTVGLHDTSRVQIDPATSGGQTTGNSYLATLAGGVSGTEFQCDLVSLNGAATAANQSTMISSLSTIAGDTTSLDAKDFATQTTLASVLSAIQSLAEPTEAQTVNDEMVTLTETQVSLTNNTSIQVLASNSSRKAPSWVQNNTDATWWCTHDGTASLTDGFRVLPGGVYVIRTTAALHCIQNSGGAVDADVTEGS